MEKEINKPNDIFVSTLLNPTATVKDLVINNINSTNTDLLDKDTYKQSKFVQKAFTDENGVFNNEAFDNVYDAAVKKKLEMDEVQTYNDLQSYTKFNDNDIFASLTSPKTDRTYEIKKVRNPLLQSEGVSHLFGKGENDKSQRELAQMHKVWDSKNQKWLDYTAEDLGLKYLGHQSLVYATWDEDGTHFDKSLGREVQHKAGEWKTDDDGLYYTETIDNKQGYGKGFQKQYVALGDILTKEDSALNKFDFFDSDDKHKSIVGTIMKTAAKSIPYCIPYVNAAWGGITAAINLASVMPTFAKTLEGIAVGDKETAFSKKANSVENYFKKFDNSHSDAATGIINFEGMMDTVSDVFGQLYQMRAAAQLSSLFKNTAKNKELISEYVEKEFRPLWQQTLLTNPELLKNTKKAGDAFKDISDTIIAASPKIKELVESEQKLSKALSLGYMALTSSADVYQDAIQGGYDRRMAGLATLVATAGQYGIMMNNRMGDWFLEGTTGYKANLNKKLIRDAVKEKYDIIAQGAKDLAVANDNATKMTVLSKVYNAVFGKGPNSFYNVIKYGGEEYWKNALIEGVEEVTEEAVMDMSKGLFDLMSSMGIGKNAATATFGGWNNTFSAEGFQRYLMNFMGGAIGGALFKFQENVIEPKMKYLMNGVMPEKEKTAIISEIIKGNVGEVYAAIDQLAKADTTKVRDVASNVNGEGATVTRGELVAKALKQQVQALESVIQDNGLIFEEGAKITEEMFKKVVRDKFLQPIIEASGIDQVITDDVIKGIAELTTLENQRKTLTETSENTKEDNKKDEKKDEKKVEEKKAEKEEKNKVEEKVELKPELEKLDEKIAAKRKELSDLLNGKKSEEYVKMSLGYLHLPIRGLVSYISKYDYAKSKYGVDYDSLQETEGTLNKQQITQEWQEYRDKAAFDFSKFREVGMKGYDLMERKFSGAAAEYDADNYADYRSSVVKKIFRDINWDISSDKDRKNLYLISEALNKAGLPGINLEDKLQLSDAVKTNISAHLAKLNSEYINKVAKALNVEKSVIENQFKEQLLESISQMPIEYLSPKLLNNITTGLTTVISAPYFNEVIKSISEAHPELSIPELKPLIDAELIKMGVSPTPEAAFNENATKESIINYMGTMLTENTEIDTNISLSESVLESFIENEKVLPAELVSKFKKIFYETVSDDQFLSDLGDELNQDDLVLDFDNDIYFDILGKEDLIKEGLFTAINENKTVEELVDEIFFTDGKHLLLDAGYKQIYEQYKANPQKLKAIRTAIINFFKNGTSAETYEKAIAKIQKINPLWDFLEKTAFQLADNTQLPIFELLKTESDHLTTLDSVADYLRQGITKDSIDNAINTLNVIQAVVYGMEGNETLDIEHQINYNVQMKRWAEKYGKDIDPESYKTISSESTQAILSDLKTVVEKLEFLKTLIETNTETKEKQNTVTKDKFHDYILNKLMSIPVITINGISFNIPTEKLEGKSKEDQLSIIEHDLYNWVQELITNGTDVDTIIKELYTTYNISPEQIFKSNLFSEGLRSDMKHVSDYDFFVYLTTILSSDTFEFDYKLKEILKSGSYKYLPLFVQEYAAKVLYAQLNDKKGIHKAATKWLYGDQEVIAGRQKTDNIFFINGIAGAGKTSAVMSLAAAMIDPNAKVIVAAPNSNQAEKLKQSLGTTATTLTEKALVADKKTLLELFITPEGLQEIAKSVNDTKDSKVIELKQKDDSHGYYQANIPSNMLKELTADKVPQYIFIDEVTHFNLMELKALSEAAKKYNIQIITSGDTLQKGALVEGNPVNITSAFYFASPAMAISMRSGNNHKNDNTVVMQSILRHTEKIFYEHGYNASEAQNILQNGFALTYHETENDIHGDKLVDEISIQDIKKLSNASKKTGSKLAIIAKTDADGKITDSNLLDKIHDAGLTENDYVVYSPEDNAFNAVQGAEANYVIIADMPDVNRDDLYQSLVSLYTYSTRALIGSVIRDNSGYQNALSIFNVPKSYSTECFLPGLDKQKTKVEERIKEIETLIGDFKPKAPETTPNPIPTSSEAKGVTNPSVVSNPLAPSVISSGISELTKEELDKINSSQEEGEENLMHEEESGKKPEGVPGDFDREYKEKYSSIYSYGFYNRLGIDPEKCRSTHYGNHMDFDGIANGKYIKEDIQLGYIKFKNLLALYPDSKSVQFREGLNDSQIHEFLKLIYSGPEESPSPTQLMDWAVDDLTVDPDIYIIAKKISKYDLSTHNMVYRHKLEPVQLFVCRKIKDSQGTLDQFVTISVLTQDHWKEKGATPPSEFAKIKKEANEICTDYSKLAIWKLPSAIDGKETLHTPFGIQIHNDKTWHSRFQTNEKGENYPNTFTSLHQIEKKYPIFFDKNPEGNIIVRLITPDKITVNGIEDYAIFHYIAQTEGDHATKTPETYKKRIDQLHKAFVDEDGKLTISGKYFAIANSAKTSDVRYKRVIILEPKVHTLGDALKLNEDMLLSAKAAEKRKEILRNRAALFSQYSQLRILQSYFLHQGVIDENGLPINGGINKFIEHWLNSFKISSMAEEADLTVQLRNIEMYYEEHKSEALGISFISDILRNKPAGDDVLADPIGGRLLGITMITHFMSYRATNAEAPVLKFKKLNNDGSVTMEVISEEEVDPNTFIVYREIQPNGQKENVQFNDGTSYSFALIKTDENNHHHLGITNHYLQMASISVSLKALKAAKLISQEELTFDDGNKQEIINSEDKVTITQDYMNEKRKSFNPDEIDYEIDNIYARPSEEERIDVDKKAFTIRPEYANGFELKKHDTVYLFNDKSVRYKIDYLNNNTKTFTISTIFTLNAEGKWEKQDVSHYSPRLTAKFSDVSGMARRPLAESYRSDDYYSSPEFEAQKKNAKEIRNNLKRIKSYAEFEEHINAFIENIKEGKNGYTAAQGLFLLPIGKDMKLSNLVQAISQDEDNAKFMFDYVISLSEDPETISQKLKSIYQNAAEEVEFDGVAIIPIKTLDMVQNLESFKSWVGKITNNYIRHYITNSSDPVIKDTTVVPKKETPKTEKKTSEKKEKSDTPKKETKKSKQESAVKTFDSVISKLDLSKHPSLMELNTEFFDNSNFSEEEKELLVSAGKLSKFIKDGIKTYFIHPKSLSKEVLDKLSIPNTEIEVGETYKTYSYGRNSEENVWDATVTAVTDDAITINRTINGKNSAKELTKSEFIYLKELSIFSKQADAKISPKENEAPIIESKKEVSPVSGEIDLNQQIISTAIAKLGDSKHSNGKKNSDIFVAQFKELTEKTKDLIKDDFGKILLGTLTLAYCLNAEMGEVNTLDDLGATTEQELIDELITNLKIKDETKIEEFNALARQALSNFDVNIANEALDIFNNC